MAAEKSNVKQYELVPNQVRQLLGVPANMQLTKETKMIAPGAERPSNTHQQATTASGPPHPTVTGRDRRVGLVGSVGTSKKRPFPAQVQDLGEVRDQKTKSECKECVLHQCEPEEIPTLRC